MNPTDVGGIQRGVTVSIAAPRSRFRGCLEVGELGDLARILDAGTHAAIWRRPTVPAIAASFSRPECRFGDHSRLVARAPSGADADALRGRVADLLPASAYDGPEGLASRAWVDDVTDLCDAFATLLAADEMMVSIEAPTTATCPRFHVDHVGIRMLVTYRGPGTQVLPDQFANRAWLGSAGHGQADEDSGLMHSGAQIVQANPFDVVLLKGEAWPRAEGFGAIHRSPNPRGEPRTLLRVDMLSQRPVGNAARS